MTAPPNHATEALEDRVRRFFARPETGRSTLVAFEPMADGHAGLTYGVDLRDGGQHLSRYVLKIAPVGVRRQGSTDIFRQAAPLEALHRAGLPVPEICWSSAGEEELGAPFIVMPLLSGRSYIIWEPHQSFLDAPEALPSFWLDGSRALARIHRFDNRRLLPAWEAPTSLASELERWSALIRHSQDAGWQAMLGELAGALRSSMPGDAPVGLIHGDFQPGNILFADSAISGIIDWDLVAIGPQGMDIGWYLMMADAGNWDAAWRPVGPAPRAAIIAAYADAGGPALADFGWHQAFAQFRLGAIAGLNLKLHRNGRRPDPVWERFALSVPVLLRTAFDLLGRRHTA